MQRIGKIWGGLVTAWVIICSASCSAQSISPSLPSPSSSQPQKGTYELFKEFLSEVNRTEVLTFRKACFECRQSAFLPKDLDAYTTSERLGEERAADLVRLLGKPTSYILDLSKPCAEFYPSIALKFSASNISIALLLYPHCQTARLVTPDGLAHGFLNIDPIADELDRILPTPWRTR